MSKRERSSDSDYSMAFVEPKRAKNEIVSFTKRRQGLFLKASELCTMVDAQIAVLVLSPSDNPFSFGHSSVDDVLRRYDNLLCQTTAKKTMRIDYMSEAQRSQASEIQGLRARARAREKERRPRRESLTINDNDIESCLTVEELHGLKLKYLNLLSKIREKLRNDSSLDFEVKEENSNLLHGQQNDASFSLQKSEITCDEGFDYTMVETLVDSQASDESFPLIVGSPEEVVVVERGNDASFSSWCSNIPDDLFLDFDFDSMDNCSPEDMNHMVMDKENDMSSMVEFGTTDGTCSFIEVNDLDCLSYKGTNENGASYSMAGFDFDYMTTPTVSQRL